MPNGTLIQNTSRQSVSASRPPISRPTNCPPMAATTLMPSAKPRSFSGKASVSSAVELAMISAPPMPWMMRTDIRYIAAKSPWPGSRLSAIEAAVKMAKPRLYIFARPNWSPSRPKATTSTAVAIM